MEKAETTITLSNSKYYNVLVDIVSETNCSIKHTEWLSLYNKYIYYRDTTPLLQEGFMVRVYLTGDSRRLKYIKAKLISSIAKRESLENLLLDNYNNMYE